MAPWFVLVLKCFEGERREKQSEEEFYFTSCFECVFDF